MNQSETKTSYDLTHDNYLNYGREINLQRSIANIDGLKKVHRRILMQARNLGRKETTSTLVGEVIKIHPHGQASIEGAISMMVRQGLLDGSGNHGIDTLTPCPAAASRYTKSGPNKDLEDHLFRLYDYCKFKEGELEGTKEPEFLITPIPIALMVGGAGIGLGGVTARYPKLSYESLLNAYRNNDPTLLEGSLNKIVDADYQSLWTKGSGSITYKMNIEMVWSKDDNANVTILSGKLGGILPNLSQLDRLVEEGRVFIRDESSKDIRIIIGRTSGTRVISDEEVFNICDRAATVTMHYRLMVSVGSTVKLLGIKNWIKLTYSNYVKVFKRWKTDQINILLGKIEEYKWLPEVGKLVLDNKTNPEIAEILGIKKSLVDRITSKTINLLRKSDYTEKINQLESRIKIIESYDPDTIATGDSKVWMKSGDKYGNRD